jgi:hypothetical protein
VSTGCNKEKSCNSKQGAEIFSSSVYPEQMWARSVSYLMTISCSIPYGYLNRTARLRLIPMLRMNGVCLHFCHKFVACTRESFSYISLLIQILNLRFTEILWVEGGAVNTCCLIPILRMNGVCLHFCHKFVACTREIFSYISLLIQILNLRFTEIL